MYRRLYRLFAVMLICLLLATTVSADMGPHFSVEVIVEQSEGQGPFYATLLSKSPSTGPASAVEPGSEPPAWVADWWEDRKEGAEAYDAMSRYEDPDGYYFLGEVFYSTDGSFAWGYMPPDVFKVLLWFPDTGELVCSQSVERFAFATVYRAALSGGTLTLTRVRNIGGQILGFLARLGVTLAIEIGLALLFGYWFLPVLKINLITQIGLNIALALFAHSSGSGGLFFYVFYAFVELIVFFTEWIYYHNNLADTNLLHPGKLRVFVYALLANVLSFGAGIVLNMLWPMAF